MRWACNKFRRIARFPKPFATLPFDPGYRVGRKVLVRVGGTEAINGVIEKTRRLAHGFRNFTNYRIRILLAADGTRPYRRAPTKTRSTERADPG